MSTSSGTHDLTQRESRPARTLDPALAARLMATRERDDEEKKRQLRARIMRERRFLIPVFIFVAMLFPNLGRAKVVGHSMEPQFFPGDALVILKTFRIFAPLKPGDIAVIRKEEGETKDDEIVKRVIFVQNKEGNATFPAKFTTSRGNFDSVDFFPQFVSSTAKIPPGAVIVVGDNMEVSQDSRDPAVGVVLDSEIKGKVLKR